MLSVYQYKTVHFQESKKLINLDYRQLQLNILISFWLCIQCLIKKVTILSTDIFYQFQEFDGISSQLEEHVIYLILFS